MEVKAISAIDAPYDLPDGMNLFDWSFPYVIDKVMIIWKNLINQCSDRELDRLPDDVKL